MNSITALQQAIVQGGKLENGYITKRVLVIQGNGGNWYKLELSNTTITNRTVTFRREDCTTSYPVPAQDASKWLDRLQGVSA